jgi:hypothetical protein
MNTHKILQAATHLHEFLKNNPESEDIEMIYHDLLQAYSRRLDYEMDPKNLSGYIELITLINEKEEK